MPSLSRILLHLLPLASVLANQHVEPSGTKDPDVEAQSFQDLLNALPEESLHVALHKKLPDFQDGVFESDRHGVQRVHSEDPPLASRLLEAAALELLKRQASPTNQTSESTAPSSQAQSSQAATSNLPATSNAPATSNGASSNPPASSAPSSSQQSAVVIPVTVQTTNAKGQTTVISTAILSAPTASVAVAVTKTDSAGKTTVITSNAPAVIVTRTDSAGHTTVQTSAASFAPTAGQVLTTTDSKGSTFLTTYTPDGGQVSSIFFVTTTGADGQPLTLTSYAYVGASATKTGGAQGTGTNTAKPGLQSGAAGVLSRSWGAEVAAVVGGAVGVAWFL